MRAEWPALSTTWSGASAESSMLAIWQNARQGADYALIAIIAIGDQKATGAYKSDDAAAGLNPVYLNPLTRKPWSMAASTLVRPVEPLDYQGDHGRSLSEEHHTHHLFSSPICARCG
jgi:hypothetical protein